MDTQEKLKLLESRLRALGSVAVAYSGGVDSTFLLAVAQRVLGPKALAVTAVSATYAAEERVEAQKVAQSLGVEHLLVETDELADASFAANPPQRCYHCKRALAAKLKAVAAERGLTHVAIGTNADDTRDFRPGIRAAQEYGLLQPLLDVGLTKEEIRRLSREMGLPTWDRPAAACLASRFPYGEEITEEKLRQVELAEAFLHQLGFHHVRVRRHGNIARIEVEARNIGALAEGRVREQIAARLKALGFAYVTLDLEGYRVGSMNGMLSQTD